MTKHHKITDPTLRKEGAEHRRKLLKRGYEGLGHWGVTNMTPAIDRRVRERERMIIAYAAALGLKRGLFTEAEPLGAVVVGEPGADTATVGFFRYREVRGAMRAETMACAHITVENLNWAPAEPIEEIVPAMAA